MVVLRRFSRRFRNPGISRNKKPWKKDNPRRKRKEEKLERYTDSSLIWTRDQVWIDSHCHLDRLGLKLSKNLGQAPEALFQKLGLEDKTGRRRCVAIFCEHVVWSKMGWRDSLREDILYSSLNHSSIKIVVGSHPQESSEWNDFLKAKMKRFISIHRSNIAAVGGCGMDRRQRFWSCDPALQRKSTLDQIEIAQYFNLPIVLYSRESSLELLALLKRKLPRDWLLHKQSHVDNWAQTQEWMRWFPRTYFGLTFGILSHHAPGVKEMVQKLPLDQILIGSDAPSFPPRGFGYSTPSDVWLVAKEIAKIKGLETTAIMYHHSRNTERVYGFTHTILGIHGWGPDPTQRYY